MISVVILEDDPIFRDMLLDMLPKATIKTNLLATCSTIRQAKEAIEQFSLQLVLLYLELPDGKGMELLTHYDEFGGFENIFITSHDKAAIVARHHQPLCDRNVFALWLHGLLERWNSLSYIASLDDTYRHTPT